MSAPPVDDWPADVADKFYTDFLHWPKLGPERRLDAERAEFPQWLYHHGAYRDDGDYEVRRIEGREA